MKPNNNYLKKKNPLDHATSLQELSKLRLLTIGNKEGPTAC